MSRFTAITTCNGRVSLCRLIFVTEKRRRAPLSNFEWERGYNLQKHFRENKYLMKNYFTFCLSGTLLAGMTNNSLVSHVPGL
jgi:hypothetical protein